MELAGSASVLGLDPRMILDCDSPADLVVFAAVVAEADKLAAELDKARAVRIAAAVSKRLFGK